MRVGISMFAWTSRFGQPHLELMSQIKRWGFSGVEIPMFDPSMLPVKDIRDQVERDGLDCTVCAILPEGINPISPDALVRKTSVAHLKQCIETAAEMGARLLGGPLFAPIGYLPGHRPTEEEWMWAVDAFSSLSETLDVNNMTLSIEPVNRSETFFLRTAAEAKRFCELIGNPRIGVTIDTFHANIEELSIPLTIQSLGHRLKHIHASENNRGPLGRGHVPFAAIISTLRAIDFDGYVMIEGFGYSAQEQEAPGQLWASVEVSPETLAIESLRYLRSLLGRPTN